LIVFEMRQSHVRWEIAIGPTPCAADGEAKL
jgi:hypothetical protein